jgi:cytochrome c2
MNGGIALALMLCLAACAGDVIGVPEPRTSSSDSGIESGRHLIASYGCGTCHSIPGVPGADSMVAPPLDRFYQRGFIAGRISNTMDNLSQWIQDPQKIDPGNAMPNLGVKPDEAHDIATYLYHDVTWGDLINQ